MAATGTGSRWAAYSGSVERRAKTACVERSPAYASSSHTASWAVTTSTVTHRSRATRALRCHVTSSI